jgi:hypothetical protein
MIAMENFILAITCGQVEGGIVQSSGFSVEEKTTKAEQSKGNSNRGVGPKSSIITITLALIWDLKQI